MVGYSHTATWFFERLLSRKRHSSELPNAVIHHQEVTGRTVSKSDQLLKKQASRSG